jgi:O-antigen/teichoic acid export membrane protein
MDKKEKIISDTKNYVLSMYIAKLVSFPCGIITARWLGPLLYGTWNAVKIILTYTPFLQLGISSGVKREVPILKGALKSDDIETIKESAANAIFIISLIFLICLIISTFFLGGIFSPLIINGLRIVGFIAFFNLSETFFINLLEAEGTFSFSIRVNILKNVFTGVAQVILVVLFGIYGVFAAVFLGAMLAYLYLRSKVNIKLNFFCIKLQAIKNLMKPGVPMLLIGIAHTFFYAADRLVILSTLGKKALGIYAIALLVSTFLEFIPSALFRVLLPNVLERIGKDKKVLESKKIWFNPAMVLSYVMPVLTGIVWIVAPVLVQYVLPKYVDGIGALKVLSVSVYFLALISVYRIFFIGLNKHYSILFMYIPLLAVNVGLSLSLVWLGMGIFGVALATLISCFLLSNIMLGYSLMYDKDSIYEKIKAALIINGPIFYVGVLLLAFDNIFFPEGVYYISTMFLKLTLLLILSSPLLYNLNLKTGVLNHLLVKTKAVVSAN